jgi:1-acyl-sn-glycerol-3-phosphate acyltransferase
VGLISLLQLAAMLLATLVIASLALLFGLLGWDRLAFAQVRAWAGALHGITGVRSRGHDLHKVPTEGSYVVIANHASHLDGPALVAALPHPMYFVIKKELARIPLWGVAAVKIGFIAIDRADSQQARARMDEAVKTVRSGRRIIVFAEGTRSADGRLHPFRKGGFHLAIDAGVPVLPVAINGSHRLYPKGAKRVQPGVVDVLVCDPIPTEGLTKADVSALAERARTAILDKRRMDPDFPGDAAEAEGPVESAATPPEQELNVEL